MAQSRLKLDFSLSTMEQRQEFLNNYIQQLERKNIRLTNDELEMCGNYLLWGRDTDGKNEVQHKNVYINSKNSPWTTEPDHDSLDALLEIPTFNENSIRWPHQTQYTTPKETFSRKDALRDCPDSLRPTLLELFHDIDTLEYTLNLYELKNGKRKNPPRPELVSRLSEEEKDDLAAQSEKLNNYSYLKKRHLLVELRRQQYTLRDSYKPTLIFENMHTTQLPVDPPKFGAEIQVLPLGLFEDNHLGTLIFQDLDNLQIPKDETDLHLISKIIWSPAQDVYFDFRRLEHVYELFQQYFEVDEAINRETSTIDTSLEGLLRTLLYYTKLAQLTDIQEEILKLKIQKKKNSEIANYINEKYGKSYTDNYISTIFRQKIIKAINEAAAYHLLVFQNIFFEEEFKKCNTCGRLLLKDPHNFVRKARAKDGFTNRCKDCDRLARQMAKGD